MDMFTAGIVSDISDRFLPPHFGSVLACVCRPISSLWVEGNLYLEVCGDKDVAVSCMVVSESLPWLVPCCSLASKSNLRSQKAIEEARSSSHRSFCFAASVRVYFGLRDSNRCGIPTLFDLNTSGNLEPLLLTSSQTHISCHCSMETLPNIALVWGVMRITSNDNNCK